MTSIKLNAQKLLGFRLKNTGVKAGTKPGPVIGAKPIIPA